MRASPLLLLLLLLCALGCERRAGVRVTVQGLKDLGDFQSLRLTVQRDGETLLPAKLFAQPALQLEADGDRARLGIEIRPAEARGQLTITVTAVGDGPYALGQGSLTTELGDRNDEGTVTLTRSRVCSQSGWCWEAPALSARQLNAIWGSADDDIWAAGAFGTLLHYDGALWSPVPLPKEVGDLDLNALWGSGRDDVWAAGDKGPSGGEKLLGVQGGAVLHYDGQRWSAVKQDPSWSSVTGLWGVGRGEVWIAGAAPLSQPTDGFLLRCTASAGSAACDAKADRLSELVPLPAKNDSAAITGVWTLGGAAPLWAVGSVHDGALWTGFVLRRAGDGPWALIKTLDTFVLSRVWGTEKEVWVGSPGQFFRQSDQWKEVAGAFPQWDDRSRGIRWGLSSQGPIGKDAYGRGAPPELVMDSIAAAHQPSELSKLLRATSAPTLRALWAAPSGDLWAAGDDGMIRHHDGKRWDAPGTLAPPPVVRGLYAQSATRAFAVGPGGTILRLQGSAWVAEASPAEGKDLSGVFGVGEDVFAVGAGGTVLRRRGDRDPAAQKDPWVREDSGTTADLYGIWGRGPGDLLAVGDGGTILRWSGERWTQERSGGPTLLAVSGTEASGERWAVGCSDLRSEAPQLAALRLVGGAWEEVPRPPEGQRTGCFTSVYLGDPARVWANAVRVVRAGIYGPLVFQRGSAWTVVGSGSGTASCLGLGQPDLWCPVLDGSLLRSNPGLQRYFEMGSLRRTSFESRLLRLGDDLWDFGIGILRCRKGLDCAEGRH